ncbi:MAG: peptidoglycan DD-metalloendopeptidase family protein [Ruminococcus sp.]|nr:peptidoglycan DD-metalloendopeptidase family protein [Ruminococcus sp.]
MKRIKMILCAMLSVCIVSVPVFGSVLSASAEDVDSLRTQLAELKQKESEYKDILSQSENEIADQKQYNDALVEKITVLGEKINLTRESIEQLNQSIAENQKKIDEGNAGIEDQLSALCERLRTIYMAGSASDLEIILGAHDFSDLIDKMNLVKNLSKYDKDLIDAVNVKLAEIQVHKDALLKDKETLSADKQSLDEDMQDLNNTLEKNKNRLSTLEISQKDTQNVLDNLSDHQSELEANIAKILEEQQREAQAAMEAAKHKNESSDSSGDSSHKEDATPTPTPDPDPEPDPTPTPEPEPDPEPQPEPQPSPSGSYVWPAPGVYYISSDYGDSEGRGYSHSGVDIAGPMYSTIVAADSGTVIATYSGCVHNWGKSGDCGCGGSYGNYVMIDHGNGKWTIYGHLASVSVSEGQSVSAGQQIGLMGSTGHSTGPHLHFECRLNGDTYDPDVEIHYRSLM